MSTSPRSPEQVAADLKRLRELHASDRDRRSLLHEIAVYQEELLVQNEALTSAQAVLEETRDRFIELYDFAPYGYLTLDDQGVILQANLTAAAFLGRSQSAIVRLPLMGFVAPDARTHYFDLLRQCRLGSSQGVEAELTLQVADNRREVQLLCRPHRGPDGGRQHLTAIIDLSERRELERERERTASERASLTTRLLAGIEKERQRIARNLHDDVGQQVTAIRLKIEAMLQVGTASPADVEAVQEMVEHLDRRLHVIATELRPSALDFGLITAVSQFVREWSAAIQVPAVFHAQGISDGDMSPDSETHVYRIVQEALNNIAKHAAAQQVSVLLERRDGEIVLIVEDDGRGFENDERRADSSRLGLIGMSERAQMAGGRLEVESSFGRGTSLFVYVPAEKPIRGGEDP